MLNHLNKHLTLVKKTFISTKIKLRCDKGKHDWEYCTWGNAFVDNLDNTFSIWSIPSRSCKTCEEHEMKLKNEWEKAKKIITIKDLE